MTTPPSAIVLSVMRTFEMSRAADESGVSGTGVVIEGVEFTDGRVAVRWRTATASTVVYDSLDDFLAIHVYPHPGNGSLVLFSDGERIWQTAEAGVVEVTRPS